MAKAVDMGDGHEIRKTPNRALWSQGILPLARKVFEALAEGLRPWFDGLELGIDLDAVPALAEDRERLWAQVGAADFLTTEEKRAAVGLDQIELQAQRE